MKQTAKLAAWIGQVIEDFIETSPQNTLQNKTNDRAFDTPLVGFSRGDDPLYETYKEVVGPFHWTPLEIFTRAFKGLAVKPEDLTVISWILPQTKATKADNRKQTTYPAESWARARIFGEEVNVKLRKHVVAILQENGYPALAPMLSDQWKRKKSDTYVFASTWSGRSGMPLMLQALELSASVTGLLPRGAKPCAPDRWSHTLKSPRPKGRIAIITPIASGSRKESVGSVFRVARLAHSTKAVMTRSNAARTSDR
jgi:hypothetical protein